MPRLAREIGVGVPVHEKIVDDLIPRIEGVVTLKEFVTEAVKKRVGPPIALVKGEKLPEIPVPETHIDIWFESAQVRAILNFADQADDFVADVVQDAIHAIYKRLRWEWPLVNSRR